MTGRETDPALSPYPQAGEPAPASAGRRRGGQEGPDGRIGHAGSAQRRYAHDPLTHLRVVVGDSDGQALAVAAVQRVYDLPAEDRGVTGPAFPEPDRSLVVAGAFQLHDRPDQEAAERLEQR